MFHIENQGVLIVLLSLFVINNLIANCNGQVTSCYVGETYTNNIGYTFIQNCGASCSKSSNQSSLSYKCSFSYDCKQDGYTCCSTDNCNKPPNEAIPLTTIKSCYTGYNL